MPIDDEVLLNHAPVYPLGRQNTHETILKINNPSNVTAAVSGKSVPSSFELIDLKLRYETIENSELSSEVQSACSTDLFHSNSTAVKSFAVSATSTMIHENINLPRKRLKHVIIMKM